jgi:protein-S-isoprenylcysteine O-methyltransferase Ste14
MQAETVFRIIIPALIAAFVAHRGYYTRKYGVSDKDTLKKREDGLAAAIGGLLALAGLIAMVLYATAPELTNWASLRFPLWLRWAGVGLALSGFALLQWAQNTLGKNWSDAPRMMKGQSFITNGPYRFIRHPIYTAFILILGSTLFISSNWLIGFAWLGMPVLETASRIGFEESLMIEYFDDRYREYIRRTGSLFPRLMK